MWIIKATIEEEAGKSLDVFWAGGETTFKKEKARRFSTHDGAEAACRRVNAENGGGWVYYQGAWIKVEFKIDYDE